MPSIKLDATLIWGVAKAVVPIIMSASALFFVLKDRHPKLEIRAKFGDWYKLKVTLAGAEIMFQGVIEVYNRSSRANAVRGYGFEQSGAESGVPGYPRERLQPGRRYTPSGHAARTQRGCPARESRAVRRASCAPMPAVTPAGLL